MAQSLGVSLAACFAHSGLRACGLADLDLLFARGQGVADPQAQNPLVPRLGVRLSADFNAGSPHFVVRPFVELRVALLRPSLRLNHEAAFTVPVLGFSGGAMLGWQRP